MALVYGCVTGCVPSRLLFYSYTGSCPSTKPPGASSFSLPVSPNGCYQGWVDTGWYVVWADTPCNKRVSVCPVYVPQTAKHSLPLTTGRGTECTEGRLQINDTAFDGLSIDDAVGAARSARGGADAYTLVLEWVVTKEAGADPVERVKGGYIIDTGGGEGT